MKEDEGASLLARGGRAVARGVRRGWGELPRGAFLRWVVMIVAGAALSMGFAAGLTLWAKQAIPARGWDEWDREVIVSADDWRISYTDAIIFESPGNILILLPLTLAAAGICLARGRLLWGLTLVACYGWARLLIFAGWSLWDRARPDLVGGGAASLKTHTFPSGHAVLVFTTYGLLAYFWIVSTRSWIDRVVAVLLLVAIATVVSAGRLRLGAHWPTDVAGGALMGVFWLGCCVAALEVGRRGGRGAIER